MNRAIIVPALVTAFVALSPVGVALADNPHDPTINPGGPATGQPSFSETVAPPGHSSPGFTQHAEGVYANPDSQGARVAATPT